MNCGRKARELSSIDSHISHCDRLVIASYLTTAKKRNGSLVLKTVILSSSHIDKEIDWGNVVIDPKAIAINSSRYYSVGLI